MTTALHVPIQAYLVSSLFVTLKHVNQWLMFSLANCYTVNLQNRLILYVPRRSAAWHSPHFATSLTVLYSRCMMLLTVKCTQSPMSVHAGRHPENLESPWPERSRTGWNERWYCWIRSNHTVTKCPVLHYQWQTTIFFMCAYDWETDLQPSLP